MTSEQKPPPFDRWGRVAYPLERVGVYLLVETESLEGWKVPPPLDAVRVWSRRVGVADDHDDNFTLWLHGHQLREWFSSVDIAEWLPQGVEPDWTVA